MIGNPLKDSSAPFIVFTWMALVAVALATRPLLPVDETRYLSVAWEMWHTGEFLVPHLNGQPYSHKPPLLFWLIHAGWTVFGVSEWWARLVAPLFALANLFLVGRLARRLWPERPEVAGRAPWLLLGLVPWAVFGTLTYFDMLVGFFALAALICVAEAASGRWWAWGVAGLAVGLGGLAKGPVILVHTLPAMVLAPLWLRDGRRGSWISWYGGVVAALALATIVALAWAWPAAKAGGFVYGQSILWGQTAGRVSSSFAHGQPWWFYGAILVPLLLPWCLWPRAWRAAKRWREGLEDVGGRFSLVWLASALVIMSAVSAKQPHYLVPSLPAVVLLLAGLLPEAGPTPDRPGVAATLARWSGRSPAVALAMVALVAAGHFSLAPFLRNNHDLAPVGRYLAELQAGGAPLVHVSKYHGQFHFLGRLRHPIDVVLEHEILDWALKVPSAKVISLHDHDQAGSSPEFIHPHRGKTLVVRDLEEIRRHPEMVTRGYRGPPP